MAYGCSGLHRQPIMCRVITMFHGAWMSGQSLLAGGSGHIYAGYNGVPCGMDERTVSPVPKTLQGYGFCSFGCRKMYVQLAARYFEPIRNSGGGPLIGTGNAHPVNFLFED